MMVQQTNLARRFCWIFIFLASLSHASVTRVGNADEGQDLEDLSTVKSGVLIETRQQALQILKNLNTQGIDGLGSLQKELEKSDLFLASKDVPADPHQEKGFDVSEDGKKIYARTFAEPAAATRFFPIALSLTSNQLVALHIHEALHRALPASVRENEKAVSEITLSLTAPEASTDRVREITKTWIQKSDQADVQKYEAVFGVNRLSSAKPSRTLERPSQILYTGTSFTQKDRQSLMPISSMHSLQSFLHPFGDDYDTTGIGIELNYLNRDQQNSVMGPLRLSARKRLVTYRDFDLDAWIEFSSVSLADDEIKSTPLTRDLRSVGLSLSRQVSFFYIENRLGYTASSTTDQKVGRIEYHYNYGSSLDVVLRAGAYFKGFQLGGILDLTQSQGYEMKGGNFEYRSAKFRLLSAGPELAYNYQGFRVAVLAKTIIDRTAGYSYDDLANVLQKGLGTQQLQTQISYSF
jgi:hypothetical protein